MSNLFHWLKWIMHGRATPRWKDRLEWPREKERKCFVGRRTRFVGAISHNSFFHAPNVKRSSKEMSQEYDARNIREAEKNANIFSPWCFSAWFLFSINQGRLPYFLCQIYPKITLFSCAKKWSFTFYEGDKWPEFASLGFISKLLRYKKEARKDTK